MISNFWKEKVYVCKKCGRKFHTLQSCWEVIQGLEYDQCEECLSKKMEYIANRMEDIIRERGHAVHINPAKIKSSGSEYIYLYKWQGQRFGVVVKKDG